MQNKIFDNKLPVRSSCSGWKLRLDIDGKFSPITISFEYIFFESVLCRFVVTGTVVIKSTV